MRRCSSFVIATALLFAGCTITHSVDPVGYRTIPDLLCIEENETVWSKEFLPWLEKEFQRHGFETIVYRDAPPQQCHLTATYLADWNWDLALYLRYAEIRLFEDGKPIGRVEYDATGGGANLGKFGRTDATLKPLIDSLLSGTKLSRSEEAPAIEESSKRPLNADGDPPRHTAAPSAEIPNQPPAE